MICVETIYCHIQRLDGFVTDSLHKLLTFVRVAAKPCHHRYVHADEDREQGVEWLLQRVEPHCHDSASASVVHISKLLDDFIRMSLGGS